MGKYFNRQTMAYLLLVDVEYFVLFAHKNVAETTTIKPVFTHTGLGVRFYRKRESRCQYTLYQCSDMILMFQKSFVSKYYCDKHCINT